MNNKYINKLGRYKLISFLLIMNYIIMFECNSTLGFNSKDIYEWNKNNCTYCCWERDLYCGFN